MTREEAISLYNSKFWEGMSARDIAIFQLTEERWCMPLNVFHRALSEALGRDVYTHELAFPNHLMSELIGDKPRPTLKDILNLIPENKRAIVIC